SADWTRGAGDSISSTFTGDLVEIRGVRAPGYGAYCDVYIDGTKAGSFTAYSPTDQGAVVVWTSPTLAQGVHSLTVVHTGLRHPAATDNMMLVDCFFVRSTPGPYVTRCLDCHEEMARAHSQ
ncbi:MAG: hypothetical protein N3B11_08045, partial [Coriobacteriia bacterium]|nr:hypothetical protein [Coriobacteriia bacterium]